MKKIKVIDLGYYHPSNANWSYTIHLVIDKTGARLYKSNFGGDSRIKNVKIEKLSAGRGSNVKYMWGDISGLNDIEDYNGTNWDKN